MGNLQSSPSSSNTTRRKKYEVFLSFRGEDTRDCFTSHLYEALRRKQIETFIDNQLIRGDEISPALTRVIKESKISVVIFSKDYASSKWCLRKLVQILKCKKRKNQIVLPVFYRVDPSDVRNQTGSFKDSFVKHENELQEKVQEEEQVEVQTWRKALTEASKLSGWHSSNGRTDATLVEEIVNDICKKLTSGYIPPDFGELIGLKPRIKQIISSLCLHVKTDVRIIGIWGMGGIGKTTLANAIFNQNSNQFEGVCFIQNVREKLENYGGLVSMQKEILSKVLDDGDLKLDSLTIPPKIKERLNRLKVFIVLDDVDNSLKMETLVEGVDGLGQGSRIIITSRDKQVLRNCHVNDDNICEVKGLNCHEALQLFCKYAFHENCHSEDPMVYHLVKFINGNPLALKVLGSMLYKKSKQDWESVVNKFEPTNLSNEIFDMLKISYNGLLDIEKGIFLDIACFLKGGTRDYVEKILNDCRYSLSVLIDKSLITISSDDRIEMHDLLEEMGRDIVNKESPNEIGTRSRLWRQEDVLCTLKNDYGTPAVRGIFLDMSKINKDIHLSPRAFKEMYNLRLLKFYNYSYSTHSKVNFSEGLSDLSDKLRSLVWYGYPLQALPSNFNPNNLVELDLNGSNLERLWEDLLHAPKLRWLNLSGCTRVTKIPDLSKSPLLELINLKDCSSLLDFPQLAQHLKYFVYLDRRGCNSLRSFPSGIHFESLTSLVLSNCNNLTNFSISGNKITHLDLSNCKNLEMFPSGICNLTSLRHLDLSDCSRLEILSENLGNLKSLEYLSVERAAVKELPSSICNLTSLRHLDLSGCSRLEILSENLGNLKSLEYLSVERAAVKELPSSICNLTSLRHLDLSDCSRLEILSENLGNLKSLEYLLVERAAVKELPSSICNLTSLRHLDLSGCSRLEILSENLGNLKSLEYLSVERAAVKELPSSICNLTSLRHLDLSDCSRLEMLPEKLENLKSFKCLSAISQLPSAMKRSKKLEMLSRRGCSGLRFFHFSGLPCSLECLQLDNCNMVVSLTDLPSNLTHLSACDCKQLQSIPNELVFARILDTNTEAKRKPTSFIFTNCMNLEETAVGNMLERLMKFLHYMCRVKMGYINFIFCYPGSEVPKWFTYTTEGSSIKFQQAFNRNLKGFAVCAVIAFEKYLFNGDSQHKLGVHFDGRCGDGDQSSPPIIMSQTAYFASRNRTLIGSDHVAFGYCDASYHSWHFGRQVKYHSFEFRLSEESPNCRLKSCGVCPIYHDDSDEEEMEPHPKENENLQTVKYAEPIEHIGETSGIRRSRTSNDHLEEEVEPHPKRLNI